MQRSVLLLLALVLVAPSLAAQRARVDAAALAAEGWAAIEARRFGDALDAFTAAAAARQGDAATYAGAGVAAFMLGQNADAQHWLERALKIAPQFTDASLLLGQLHYRAGRVSEAIAVYEAALTHEPGHPEIEQRLAQWRSDARLRGTSYRSPGAHFSVLFQGTADELIARRAVEILEAAYWRVGGEFRIYPEQPITVVLSTQQQFRDITRSPEWAAGAYDGTIRVPVRGALEHDADLERVLAHEFVHALVSTIGGRNVPVWLDEGLASMFEPRSAAAEDAALLRHAGDRPPLKLLERSFSRLSGGQAQYAYAQSTVAVRRLVQLRGMHAVVALLQDLGRGITFDAAFHQRIAVRYDDFAAAVARE